jgi:hypothetical protein
LNGRHMPVRIAFPVFALEIVWIFLVKIGHWIGYTLPV